MRTIKKHLVLIIPFILSVLMYTTVDPVTDPSISYVIEAIGIFYLVLLVYLIPAIIAVYRNINDKSAIYVNIFAGWSIGGWIYAFYLAVRNKDNYRIR